MEQRRRIYYSVGMISGLPLEEGDVEPEWFLLSPLPPEQRQFGRTLPFPVAIRVGRGDGGRLVCNGLRMGAEAVHGWNAAPVQITATDLRDIPLGQIMRDLAEMLAFRLATKVNWGEAFQALEIERAKPPSKPGCAGYPKEHWLRIADLFREAWSQNIHNVSLYVGQRATYLDGRRYFADTDDKAVWRRRGQVVRNWGTMLRKEGILEPAPLARSGDCREDGPSRESGHDISHERKERP